MPPDSRECPADKGDRCLAICIDQLSACIENDDSWESRIGLAGTKSSRRKVGPAIHSKPGSTDSSLDFRNPLEMPWRQYQDQGGKLLGQSPETREKLLLVTCMRATGHEEFIVRR